MLIPEGWKDYELLDAGGGEKLERWGRFVLRRPDPQAIWPMNDKNGLWENPDAHYHRSRSGGGSWEYVAELPKRWAISYKELTFYVEPTGFKHTGLFPEQAANWEWIGKAIKEAGRPVRVLNLFAYTGGATVAAACAGAEVCHVDAAKGMVERAKENLKLSGLAEKPVRFIVDDAMKFVLREGRRGKKYDAVVMDPPSYGRGPKGEMWKIEDELYGLVRSCMDIISDEPLFFLINSYTTGLSPMVLRNILTLTAASKFGGAVSSDEIGLPIPTRGIVLPCGASGRWRRG